jgi:hypothetical protein
MSTVPSDPGVRSPKRTQVRRITVVGGPAAPSGDAGHEALVLGKAEAAEGAA